MNDILALVYEYRRLLARRELMGGDLSDESKRRLDSLERMLGEPTTDSKRQHARSEVLIPATLLQGHRVQPVSIIDVGGGGVRVSPAPTIRPGEKATIRIVDGDTGSVYHYPVVVKWYLRNSEESSMGMPFVGAPKQTPVYA
jgi:hypothetical protein